MMLIRIKKPLGHSGTIVDYPFAYVIAVAVIVGILSMLGGIALYFLSKS